MTNESQPTLSSSGAAVPEVVPTVNPAVPQFDTAEYAHRPGEAHCGLCDRALQGEYYRVNGLMACQQCAQESADGQPKDSHKAFSRGVLFGISGALLGLIGYAAVVIITGWSIGYLALGVGWLVATAIRKGAHGLGGRRYQIAAVVLTYLAISMSAIPIGITSAIKERTNKPATVQSNDASPDAGGSEKTSQKAEAPQGLGHLVLLLLWLGIASPFYAITESGTGFIGLIILFVGLRIAWQMAGAKPLEVDGPYALEGALA